MEVLVTGGDTDLGRTVAEGFRDDGHKVTLVGARRDDLEVVAKELDADAIACDITNPASLAEVRGCSPTIWTPSSTCRRRPGMPAIRAPTRWRTPPRRGAMHWTPPRSRRC
ncbi:short chain dehydrogenase family protein [Mycobacterium ulcerans str. Harvey]|uniref:Short chain dehydrogenase family protein n=1 Tax=Mycobacterium ulcerans str. Harvey TaxID=1299332 RepID=A0ABN0QVE0_MYCUL|nr:short chain dehydrogenase family protein [Mycobacterium ulcerans str. Harvey]